MSPSPYFGDRVVFTVSPLMNMRSIGVLQILQPRAVLTGYFHVKQLILLKCFNTRAKFVDPTKQHPIANAAHHYGAPQQPVLSKLNVDHTIPTMSCFAAGVSSQAL